MRIRCFLSWLAAWGLVCVLLFLHFLSTLVGWLCVLECAFWGFLPLFALLHLILHELHELHKPQTAIARPGRCIGIQPTDHTTSDPQRITSSVDDLSSLSSRTLADAGGSRSRAGRTVGRINPLEDAEGPCAEADDPTAAKNAAATSAPGQAPPDASKYMAVCMADADGAEPSGNQGAGVGHAHPPS